MINRITKLREIMKSRNIEGVIVDNPVNVRYMSGFTGGEAKLFITCDKTILLTDFRYTEQAGAETGGLYEIVKVTVAFYEVFKKLIANTGIVSLGIEENYISHKEYKGIQEALAGIDLIDQNMEIEKLRQIKDENELSIIREAARIGDKAFAEILKFIRPGITENDVKNHLEYIIKNLGASGISFETIIASGVRSAMPHGTASNKIIVKGDIVTIDFGCIYNGYCSDMTRTFFVGDSSITEKAETAELIKIYNIVNDARAIAVKAAKAGITGKDLDRIARKHITKHGYGDNFGHGLGHGVGLNIHEEPNANLRNDLPLPAGAVITIEPGIYLEGYGGVRIEDMVIIKENGCEIITSSGRELMFIDNRY